MEKKSLFSTRIGWLICGMVLSLCLVFLTGAVDTANTTLSTNRYQISSFGTQLGSNSGVFGAFVMDSASGETRLVYARLYGDPGKGQAVVDQLRKNFGSVQ